MTDESQGFDAYELVLADLRTKRDQIDQAIRAIEAIRSGAPAASAQAPPKPPEEASTLGPGAFLGMSIPAATRKLLASQKRQMNNTEILAALKAGGLVLNSADPLNTIGAVITRRFKDVGDIVRVGRGVWGLKEWYPNRSFKAARGAENGEKPEGSMNGTSASEQPSEPTQSSVPK